MLLKKIENFIFYSLIFFLPSQLGFHFWPSWAFVFGVRVDYLAPTVYLTDILVFILVSISRTKVNHKILLYLSILATINIFYSISPFVSFVKWIKVLELVYLCKYIYDNFEKLKTKMFAYVLSFSLLMICVLGLLQFVKSSTVGSLFYLIGERVFNVATPGIALQNFFGKNYLRVYSSFSHPNSLAGYLLITSLYLLFLNKRRMLTKITIGLAGTVFVLTSSLSSFVTLIFLPFLKKHIKYLLPVILIFSFSLPLLSNMNFYSLDIKERIEQSKLAINLIKQNFLSGIGLGTFVIKNPHLQPVHNIYLLVLVETGILGFTGFVYLLTKLIKKANVFLIAIIIIGLFDHYFLTLQQNQLLLPIVIGASFKNQKILKSA